MRRAERAGAADPAFLDEAAFGIGQQARALEMVEQAGKVRRGEDGDVACSFGFRAL